MKIDYSKADYLHRTDDPEGRFTGLPLRVSYSDGRTWVVLRNVSYRTLAGPISTVRVGFAFDFASIPRLFWRLTPPAGKGYGLAAVWHDWLYAHHEIAGKPIVRRQADDLFLEIMRYAGVSAWMARTMWLAVRSAGWWSWGKEK